MRQLSWLGGLLLLAACADEPRQQPAEAAAPRPKIELPAAFETSQVRTLTASQLPAGVVLPAGKLQEARQWEDANGTNVLVVTRTAEQDEPNAPDEADEAEGARHVELYARQYVRRPGGYQLLWKLQDHVGHCPLDLALSLLPGSTAITDLDNDGHTETMLVYALGCRGDVSPLELKLILHEDAAKYALRGNNVVQYDSLPISKRMPATICCLDTVDEKRAEARGDYSIYDGRYHNEKDFRGAPPAFLRFARQQWRRWSAQPVPEVE
ncbi:hypothetical protein LGH70_14265 [Hymenobacter sp. BT635]|uniref:Lipoprotein n=1 Tax=Hymenobacter nitidus TaxID=2880929 RepID=A0ABS8AEA6_9BACT|nr:hypothetical protein [Hymenobacter nitidus]MCB2378763.1 hypothetical protein [Hymenobacter nitidus]